MGWDLNNLRALWSYIGPPTSPRLQSEKRFLSHSLTLQRSLRLLDCVFFSSSSAPNFFSHRLENTLSIFGIGSRNFGGYSRSHIVLYDWEWLRNHSLFDLDLAKWEFKLNRAVVGDAFYTAFFPNSTPCWLFSFRTLVLLPKIFTRGGVSSFFVLIWISVP